MLDRLLAGETVRGVTCADVEQVLLSVNYMRIGSEGAYRTWKHPSYARLLTVRDEGANPMYGRYIDKVGKHLQAVQSLGGLNVTDELG